MPALSAVPTARRAVGVGPLALLLAALLALLAPAAHAALTFPPLSGRVVDTANILPAQTRADLEAKLAGLEKQTGHQLVVATVPSLQGTDISDYSYQLGRAWGIGGKAKNDGAILLVAPTERKVWITVGYGLEGVLTDALSSIIYRDAIVPKFKAGDYVGGVEAGTDAIIAQLRLPDYQARANVASATQQQAVEQARPAHGRSGGSWIFILIILAFFILPRLFGGRSGGGGLGWLPFLFLGGGGGSWGGGGFGGGGGSDSGGGGGFSGGGGSFGGGGAGGSW